MHALIMSKLTAIFKNFLLLYLKLNFYQPIKLEDKMVVKKKKAKKKTAKKKTAKKSRCCCR